MMIVALVLMGVILSYMAGIATHYGDWKNSSAWRGFGILLFGIAIMVALIGIPPM